MEMEMEMLRRQNRRRSSTESLMMMATRPPRCKIRKRGCSPSSSASSATASSSSLLHNNHRFKRAVLLRKRAASGTPVPTWKKLTSSSAAAGSPSSASRKHPPPPPPVSARKLAATLWEMNEVPSPGDLRSRGSIHAHRRSPAIPRPRPFDSVSTASFMEIDRRSRGRTPTGSVTGVRSHLKEISNGLTASKELLKILNHFWGLKEQHSSCLSIISALHAELDQAHLQLDQLIREQRSEKREMEYLMKRFAEERVKAAVETIAGDLEVEKRMRRRSESLNKKLGVELAETKAGLSRVVEELESEKKARRIMEEICDELAKGIGDDKAKVEEMKRESEKVREEVEKEREMLQLADLLREERLQMKLSEAKYQFEEKNAAVERLRDELEAYLKSERSKQNRVASARGEFRSQLGKMAFASKLVEEREDHGEVEDPEGGTKEVEPEEDDSAESDLHSIELNMESTSKNYRSDYNAGIPIAQEDPNRVSVEEENKGRKSTTSEKTRRGSVSLERSISDGIEWFLNNKNLVNREDAIDYGRFAEIVKQNQGLEYDDELQEHRSIKGLRDHIMSGLQMASARCQPSPTRQWGQPWPLRDAGNSSLERATAGRESSLKTRQVEGKGKVRSSRHSRK